MRIILEGCDGTGKSTLAKFLAEKTGMKIVKLSQPKTDDPFQEYIELFDPESPKYVGDNIILDRCWISEMVYWPLKWRKWFSRFECWTLFNYISKDIVIITHTDINKIKSVFEKRWEDYIDLKEANVINNWYANFAGANILRRKWFVWDYTTTTKQECFELIHKFLNRIYN